MKNREERNKIVQATIAFLEGTTLRAGAYEQHLLSRFVEGEITIAEALELLELHNKVTQAATWTART
jgi:hypothetical protein